MIVKLHITIMTMIKLYATLVYIKVFNRYNIHNYTKHIRLYTLWISLVKEKCFKFDLENLPLRFSHIKVSNVIHYFICVFKKTGDIHLVRTDTHTFTQITLGIFIIKIMFWLFFVFLPPLLKDPTKCFCFCWVDDVVFHWMF